MAVRHRFTWNYGGAETFAPFFTEVKKNKDCFSFSLWLLDKPVFIGNTWG